MKIETLDEVTEDVEAALKRLVPQLSSTVLPLESGALRRVVAAEGNTVLVARLDGIIVGALALSVSPVLSAVRARIEDLVVDEAARCRGIGAALVGEADPVGPRRRCHCHTPDLRAEKGSRRPPVRADGLPHRQYPGIPTRLGRLPR